MTRRFPTILASVALAAMLPACSGAAGGPSVATLVEPGASGAAPSPTAEVSFQDAALAYARCMRENGIDMPDPVITEDPEGGVSISQAAGGGPDSPATKEKFVKADAACQHHMAAARAARPGEPLSAEDMDKLLQFARCMREHGVPMQDPTADGGIRIELDSSGSSEGGSGPKGPREDPAFEAAHEACGSLLPGKMGKPGTNVKGGPAGGSKDVVPAPADEQ